MFRQSLVKCLSVGMLENWVFILIKQKFTQVFTMPFPTKLRTITWAGCLQYNKLSAKVFLCFMFLLTERKRSMESKRLQAKACYVCVGGDTVYCWVCCSVSFFLHIMHFVAKTLVLIGLPEQIMHPLFFFIKSRNLSFFLISCLNLFVLYIYMCTHIDYACVWGHTLPMQFTLV